MVIAARSKEEAIGLIHVYEDDIAKEYMEIDTLKILVLKLRLNQKFYSVIIMSYSKQI